MFGILSARRPARELSGFLCLAKDKLSEMLCEAARSGLLDEVKRLVEKKGAEVNRIDPILSTPPLTHASAWGHLMVCFSFR